MSELVKAKEPFKFYTRMHLTELTGWSACNLKELSGLIKTVPGSSIYHHTHRFLQQHQCLSPEPPNDFAYWVTEVLGEKELGEGLASIDIVQFNTIHSLRDKIVETVDEYLKDNPSAASKFTDENEAFCFMKSVSFILPTNYDAHDLKEFTEILKKITIDSIYFHIFEAKLRLEKSANDFSNWIEHSVEDKKLAGAISGLDPYTYTLEELRKTIIKLIEKKLPK